MPTYDYECKSCGHTFDVFQSMSDEPLKTCPECGGEVRRLIGGGMGIIFKGSGFYVTDSRSGGKSTGGNGKSREEKKESSDSPSKDTAAKSDSGAAAKKTEKSTTDKKSKAAVNK